MKNDKKLALVLAFFIGLVLVGCTLASQIIYQQLLPQVRMVEAKWQDEGYILPKDAIYRSRNGDCVYGIQIEEKRFQIKYVLKEVLVTIVNEDSESVLVRGIYNPEWKYAAGADNSLENEMEVKIIH